ncbi:MAG: MnhB domain-containing protein [Gammaproteobacteria bacterium]
MRRALPVLIVVLAALLSVTLAAAMLELPPHAVRLPDAVAANIADSGVAHPITAVLLNFRGYDTLLEIAVLLLALFGVLALVKPHAARATHPAHPLLQTLARLLAPLMVLVAGYLLWVGASAPGGAFQAGAVLAAAGVLLRLAGLLPAWAAPGLLLRAGLALGLLVFVAVAAAVLGHATLLTYPPALAGGLILTIEAALTLSIGLTLAALYLASTEVRP